VLATLFASHCSQAGGQVYQTDAALGRVLVLTAWPARAKGLNAAFSEQLFVRFRNHQVWSGFFVHCGAGSSYGTISTVGVVFGARRICGAPT
jgi:hypothetical protein